MWKLLLSLWVAVIACFLGGVFWFSFSTNSGNHTEKAELVCSEYPQWFDDSIRQWNRENPDFIQILDEDHLPDVPSWETGLNEPELGDPKAIKGGHLRLWSTTPFPDTLRAFGPGSKSFYNYSQIDNVWLPLVWLHPITGNLIPGLASRWGTLSDGKTVIFEIDPQARYSNGEKVRAKDFILNLCLRTSEWAKDPYWNSFFKNKYNKVITYGDRYVSFELKDASPMPAWSASDRFYPAPPGFYKEFSGNFLSKYQWKAQPTTGAYYVDGHDVQYGTSITMKKVENWWAEKKPYFQYRFNPNSIEHRFVSIPAKGLEMFRRGEIDVMNVHDIAVWEDALECEPVLKGWISRYMIPAQYPAPPYGFYFNTGQGALKDINIRKGLIHAFDMQSLIERYFRGDKQQLKSYLEGFGVMTALSESRFFDVKESAKYFALAGYNQKGKDGIWKNEKGDRLTFELTYADTSPFIGGICSFLKQQARLCGVDLVLDPLHYDVNAKKVLEKRYQITFWAWPLNFPFPELYKTFHSSLAVDESGHLITNTDNLFSVADKELDEWLEKEKAAANLHELANALHGAQQRISDLALWVPGWKDSSTKIASWGWVHWPHTDQMKIAPSSIYNPLEGHYLWIDEAKKQEILNDRKEDIEREEVLEIYQ